jgi:hypothetical protein
MREETLEFQKLRKAVISAQLQAGGKPVAEWVYEDEDGPEALRILELESEDDHRRQVRPDLDGPRWFMGEPKRPWPGLMVLPAGAGVCLPECRRCGRQAGPGWRRCRWRTGSGPACDQGGGGRPGEQPGLFLSLTYRHVR